ncbi:YicC/YloC family endoribonuclease [Thiohalobacter sp. IOR34]|uniref:YicC/YloC family endoribonuclease n=1 Tax=Thiohalobacter sp. IOR34 TaxID=3057176 RepID=UPI0025B08DDC|nr:YicC/YloC family endoribonuclease [Thiohalobacter sp. IOR34]WJW75716.1 YicC/YloC family endoribonuclease [Thiohalobacter sp. IOR34]
MTAFARQEGEGEWGSLTWELRSVNHRYLEIGLRLPEELRSLEPVVRERAAARLKRGKLECNLRFRPAPRQADAIELDEDYLRRLAAALGRVDGALEAARPPDVLDVLRWPGVMLERQQDVGPVAEAALALFGRALDELVETREREGAGLRELILARLAAMEPLIAATRRRLPEVRARIRERLRARLEEVAAEPDSDRLEQELVYLAQKMDVDEELDRLEAHVAEVRKVLDRDEAVGRRLDFLMQELNREANTLASKSADAETTGVAVELKVLIEQMREQVQNVE